MQKVTIPKRLMTLFLVFVMVLGLLPVSNLVVPANAADARSGPDDVVTINRVRPMGSSLVDFVVTTARNTAPM